MLQGSFKGLSFVCLSLTKKVTNSIMTVVSEANQRKKKIIVNCNWPSIYVIVPLGSRGCSHKRLCGRPVLVVDG